jgi:hypothetical protein
MAYSEALTTFRIPYSKTWSGGEWRQCATKVGLGFALHTKAGQPLIDKSGQILRVEEREAVAV